MQKFRGGSCRCPLATMPLHLCEEWDWEMSGGHLTAVVGKSGD